MSWELYVLDPKQDKLIGWTNGSLEDCLTDMIENIHRKYDEVHLVWKRETDA